MNRYTLGLVFWLLTHAAGCTWQSSAPPAEAQSRVHHLVVVWLKQPGDAQAQAKVIEATRRLEGIPGVLSVSVGRTFPNYRAVVDDSFDVALVIQLTDQEALKIYQTHPLHEQLKREVLKPLVDRFIVYNFLD